MSIIISNISLLDCLGHGNKVYSFTSVRRKEDSKILYVCCGRGSSSCSIPRFWRLSKWQGNRQRSWSWQIWSGDVPL